MKFSKNVNNKKCAPKIIFFYEKKIRKDSDNFWHRKLTLKVRILAFSTTFTQLTARIKNFLVGWLLFWGLKEGLVECAIVCVKSWVILKYIKIVNKCWIMILFDGDKWRIIVTRRHLFLSARSCTQGSNRS